MRKTFDFGTTAYLMGGKSFMEMSDSTSLMGNRKVYVQTVSPLQMPKREIDFVRRGQDDKLCVDILSYIGKSTHLGANIAFNAKLAFGDGITVYKRVHDEQTDRTKLRELLPSDAPEVFDFLETNNYLRMVQEWANDLTVFNESYAEFIFNQKGNKIVQMNSLEATNSRISVADKETGTPRYHGYGYGWDTGETEDVKVSSLIDRQNPLRYLRQCVTDRRTDERQILQLMLPTPGNYYYGNPFWWSVFESGWYDFSLSIPKFKQALMKNQMTLRFHVKINRDFWMRLFQDEGISDEKKRMKRKQDFLTNLNDFLAGEQNAGKAFLSHFDYDLNKGVERQDIIITPINQKMEGGEYLEDSEEVTNVLCYAMEIHPSLIGATGKKGGINGTETRELFILKQSMMKSVRELMTLPLYLVKAINGWDRDIEFAIPNIMLTTLDQNTGAIKSIGNERV